MHAVVFPGQGIQKKGMGRGLFDEFPEMVAQADAILGYSIRNLCLDDPRNVLNQTEFTQPAIYTVSALEYLKRRKAGLAAPDYVAGFSLGEYNALCAAGAFDFATGLQLVKQRGELMSQASGGAMVAVVGLDEAGLLAALEQHRAVQITIANYNAPRQFVLSGSKTEVDRLRTHLATVPGVQMVVPLQTSGAFHSPYMNDAGRRFKDILESCPLARLAIPVISNVTGRPFPEANLKALMAEQITHPVRWSDSIRYLLRHGVNDFTELGGATVLTGMIDKIRQAEETAAAPAPAEPAPLLAQIMKSCASAAERAIQVFHADTGAEQVSGTQLADRVARLGSALSARLAPQDKVLLLFPQSPGFSSALLACWHANVIAVPAPITDVLQFAQKQEAIRLLLTSSGARYILTNGAFEGSLDEFVRQTDTRVLNADLLACESRPQGSPRPATPSDLALLLYTSGSTAQPKGVMLSHSAIYHTATSRQWGVSDSSCIVSWLPQFHAFGISFGTLVPLAHGALSVIYPPEQFIGSPHTWFELIDRYRATHTGTPNFAFDYCCSSIDDAATAGLSLASLQSLVCAGDIIRKDAYEAFARRFAHLGLRPDALTPNYGLSEAGPITVKKRGTPPRFLALDERVLRQQRVASAVPGADTRYLVSNGDIAEDTRILIVDGATGVPCPPDRIGEIWLKSPCQALGYWQDEQQTRNTFDGTLQGGEGGFLRTGDLGFVAEHQLYIVGREKDVIIVNGKNYFPADIERTLKEHLEACQLPCAAFSYDAGDAEKVVVVQEVDDGLSPPAMDELASQIISMVSRMHQLPVHDVLLVEKRVVPVTGSGKIRRSACRANYLENRIPCLSRRSQQTTPRVRTDADRSNAATTLIEAIRNQVLAPELGARSASLGDDEELGMLGLDSIRYIRIARRIEAVFQIPFKAGNLYANNTCRALAEYVLAHRPVEAFAARPQRWRDYADQEVMDLLKACAQKRLGVARTLELIKERI